MGRQHGGGSRKSKSNLVVRDTKKKYPLGIDKSLRALSWSETRSWTVKGRSSPYAQGSRTFLLIEGPMYVRYVGPASILPYWVYLGRMQRIIRIHLPSECINLEPEPRGRLVRKMGRWPCILCRDLLMVLENRTIPSHHTPPPAMPIPRTRLERDPSRGIGQNPDVCRGHPNRKVCEGYA